MEKNKITKDSLISEALSYNSNSYFIFMKHKMNCMGCPYRKEETLEAGAKRHGVDIEKLLEELNK